VNCVNTWLGVTAEETGTVAASLDVLLEKSVGPGGPSLFKAGKDPR
jgi:hypothetical protein